MEQPKNRRTASGDMPRFIPRANRSAPRRLPSGSAPVLALGVGLVALACAGPGSELAARPPGPEAGPPTASGPEETSGSGAKSGAGGGDASPAARTTAGEASTPPEPPPLLLRIDPGTAAEPWLKRQVASGVASRAVRAGVEVASLGSTGWFGEGIWSAERPRVLLRVLPEGPGVRVEWVEGRRVIRAQGSLETLDVVLDDLVARGLAPGRDVPSGPWRDLHLPLALHRMLGRAEARRQGIDPQKAMVLFERTLNRWPGRVVGPAVLAMLELRTAFPARLDRATLLEGAIDRARFAAREGRASAALDAYLAALRYGAPRPRRWQVDLPRSVRLWPGDEAIGLSGPEGWMTLDPLGGQAADRGRPLGRPIALIRGEIVWLSEDGRRLIRASSGGTIRWTRPLSGVPSRVQRSGSGQILVADDARFAWVDAADGHVSAQGEGGGFLAAGEWGALRVMDAPRRLALLRPGRDAPAWTFPLPERPGPVAATSARVLASVGGAVQVIDAFDGRPVAELLRGQGDAELLHLAGRFAVFRTSGRAVLVDALAGAVVAPLPGPSPVVDAFVGRGRILALFATGDLVVFDPDGLRLRRGRVYGTTAAARFLEAPPGLDLALLRTRDRLSAWQVAPLAFPSAPALMVSAAEAALEAERELDAAFLATTAAAASVDAVTEAEAVRARAHAALGAPEEAARARRRAAAARDLGRPLPPFRRSPRAER